MNLPTKVRIEMIPIEGRINGSLIFQNAAMPVMPSTSPASRSELKTIVLLLFDQEGEASNEVSNVRLSEETAGAC